MKNKKEIIRFIKFLFFSAGAGIIQAGSFAILNSALKWEYWPSYLIALTLSVLFNFTINRKFTFKAANNVALAMALVGLFYVVFTPLSTIGGDYLTRIGWNDYLVLAITMVLNFVLEFLYTRFVVYGKSVDNKIKKEEEAK